MRSSTEFWKLSAAGNDFVLVPVGPGLRPAELAARVCPRRTSLGADGLLVVAGAGPELEVRHHEPDGAETFCLNGLRAAAAWAAWTRPGNPRPNSVLTPHGRRELRWQAGELPETSPAVGLPAPGRLEPVEVVLWGTPRRAFAVDVGNPQLVLVLESDQLERDDLMPEAARLRWAVKPFASGQNVTCVTADEEGQIRTYERGVEGETLSCGSGAVAAAFALQILQPARREFAFWARAGDLQRVTIEDGQAWSQAPVTLVARGELFLRASA